MSQEDDKVFVRHFSIIIILLVIFTIAMAMVGVYFNNTLKPGENPSRQAVLEERIKSPAAVFTNDQAAVTAPVVAASDESVPTDSAATEDIDAAAIYQTACFACHGTGAANAPKLEAAAWTERLAQGEETLVDNAINGINAMPPKGGQMQLSDAEIRAVVEYMIAQL